MPRNISFALTTPQFKAQTKTVTRRFGWAFLKPGDLLMGCEKCQGLGKGGKIARLGLIRVVSVRFEALRSITLEDVTREGFPEMTRWEFTEFFCKHNKCEPTHCVTRIEFEYLNPPDTDYVLCLNFLEHERQSLMLSEIGIATGLRNGEALSVLLDLTEIGLCHEDDEMFEITKAGLNYLGNLEKNDAD